MISKSTLVKRLADHDGKNLMANYREALATLKQPTEGYFDFEDVNEFIKGLDK